MNATKIKKERCRKCGKRVRMIVQKHSGYCSQLCERSK